MNEQQVLSENDMPKSNTKYWLMGFGVLGLAGLGTFLALRNRNKQTSNNSTLLQEANGAASISNTTTSGSQLSTSQSGFPLKRGSRGELVRQLQQALNSFYGATLAVDGAWGRKTDFALTNAGLSKYLDAPTFANIVAGSSPHGATSAKSKIAEQNLSAKDVAIRVFGELSRKQFTGVLNLLRKIPNTSVYSTVSNWFMVVRKLNGQVRTSLLSGVLAVFSGSEKAQIEAEFVRMGLQKNQSTGKWSIPSLGFVEGKLITTRKAGIWDGSSVTMEVPSGTVLGTEMFSKEGYTKFKTIDGDIYSVLTEAIEYAY